MKRINPFVLLLSLVILANHAVCQVAVETENSFFLTAPLDKITGFKPPVDYAQTVQNQEETARQLEGLSDAYMIQKLHLMPESKQQEAFASLTGLTQERLLKDPALALSFPSIGRNALRPSLLVDPKDNQVDFRKLHLVTPIKSQKDCAACWAFATIAAFESSWAIYNQAEWINASEQDVLDCSGNGNCDGGVWAFDYLIKKGVTSTKNLAYLHVRRPCKTNVARIYSAVNWRFVPAPPNEPPTVDAMKQAMAEYGPIAVAMTVGEEFRKAKPKQVYSLQVNGDPNHAMLVIGWNNDKQAWLAKNSWGTAFCDNGYVWIKWGCSKIGWRAAYVIAQTRKFPVPALSFLRTIK